MAQQQRQQHPGGGGNSSSSPWPLYDLFVDLPHPAASSLQQHLPARVIYAPPHHDGSSSYSSSSILPPQHSKEMAHLLSQIQFFAFPEYEQGGGDASTSNNGQQLQQQQKQVAAAVLLNKYDYYAMQTKSFTSFTFSLQLQDGSRLYGHVRRSLPMHPVATTRYDVGRRGERALVVLTRAFGADLLYQAILKCVCVALRVFRLCFVVKTWLFIFLCYTPSIPSLTFFGCSLSLSISRADSLMPLPVSKFPCATIGRCLLLINSMQRHHRHRHRNIFCIVSANNNKFSVAPTVKNRPMNVANHSLPFWKALSCLAAPRQRRLVQPCIDPSMRVALLFPRVFCCVVPAVTIALRMRRPRICKSANRHLSVDKRPVYYHWCAASAWRTRCASWPRCYRNDA
jgi:hypothetical protein